MLQTLRDHRLFAIFSKCEFWFKSVTFLVHMVSKDGNIVDPAKIEAIHNCARPISSTDVHSFIGLEG